MLIVVLRCGQGRILDWVGSWSKVLIVALRCGQGRMTDRSGSWGEVLIVILRCGQGRMPEWSEVLIVVLWFGQGRMLDWSYSWTLVLIVVLRCGQGRILDWGDRPEVGHSMTSNNQWSSGSWACCPVGTSSYCYVSRQARLISWPDAWYRLSGQSRSRSGRLSWHHSNTPARSLVQIGSRQRGGGGGEGGGGQGL